jgi:hypothetical protein
MAMPFSQIEVIPIDLVQLIIKEMDANLKSIFEYLYPHHAKPHDQNGPCQISILFQILFLATIAEGKIKNIQRIVTVSTAKIFAQMYPGAPAKPRPP